MQKNNYTEDFDLFVKGSLQDAEEQPSPRVWQAIESRLGAATAPAAGYFRWGWVAVAAAAAVAAVLAIPNNSNINDMPGAEHQLLAQAASVEVAEIPAPKAIRPASGRTVKVAEAEIPDQVRNNGEGTEVPAMHGNTAEQASVAEISGQTVNDEKAGNIAEAAGAVADPFAAMDREDGARTARKAVRSIWAGGMAGGNESSAGGASYASKSGNPAYIENVITETSASNYGIPVSVGAGIKYGITENFSVSAGIDYSYLTRSFTGTYSPAGETPVSGEINHSMRYAGIPVGIYYNLLNSGSVHFYLTGVGEAEWCLGNSYNIRGAGKTVSEKVSGAQFSAGGGFGVEFSVSKLLSIYVDPTVRYYFDAGHPGNIRREKPLMLNFNAGLRFNL